MTTRRHFLLQGGAALLGVAGGFGQPVLLARPEDDDRPPDGSAARDMITPEAQQAIDQGLAYLARHQHQDGSFGAYQYHGNVAITGLAGLAFMAGGHQPGRGTYGDAVTRALKYVLD